MALLPLFDSCFPTSAFFGRNRVIKVFNAHEVALCHVCDRIGLHVPQELALILNRLRCLGEPSVFFLIKAWRLALELFYRGQSTFLSQLFGNLFAGRFFLENWGDIGTV